MEILPVSSSNSTAVVKCYRDPTQEVSDNPASNTLDNEHTSSSSSIVVEENEAPQIVSSPAEQVATEPNSLVLNANVDEFVQEDVADFDGNVFFNAPPTSVFEEAKSSLTYQDTSNMRWEIAKDAELNRFKDVLVFRKMVKFLEAIPINLKGNMWELEDMIEDKLDWNKPPKGGDGAWHIKIELIDPDGEKFDRVFQSIPTTWKLSE
ncbi:hypothetical protein Tco_0547878 [Tanacetum coccineum]